MYDGRVRVNDRSAAVAVRTGAAATLLGSLLFISTVAVTGDLSPRESFLVPLGVAGSAVAAAGLVVLIVFVPRLLRGLPLWVCAVLVGALAFTLALAWFDATAIVGVAGHTSDAVFDDIGASGGLVAFMAPKSVLGLVGFGALAWHGSRAGAFGRGTAVLFGLGALAFVLPPFPPGLVLVSIGLVAASRTRGEIDR